MTIYCCNGCARQLDPKKVSYYTVGELGKSVPKKPYRVIFKDGETQVGTEDMGWMSYEDLHYCEDCIKKPIDVAPIFQAHVAQ